MTRSALTPVLAEAVAAGRAVAAFNVIQLEHAEAYAAAAERVGLPVVMQISENCVRYHGSLAPIAVATLAIADACTQPVVVHLDHAEDVALVEEAVRLGLTSVMFDGSTLPDDENRAVTRRVVGLCRAAGVSVEAELGEVGGKDGVHAPGARTDPADAARFVADTGVDALAVAVGSSHAMTDRTAELDTDLVAALRASVPVPLVLHGSSGVPDAGLVAAVRAGMTKVNIATHLNQVFTRAMTERLETSPTVDTRKYLGAARSAVTDEAARLMQLLALR
ncbi:class II fructose-bisphosphate aldolase [Terrabacter sp. 2YAF2]|uniref:class II fructose-bisphosphate aldolase n=1 Tax=Terrabacter sp. 2YAF2 TaxID=3233026 RepID=UPI003F9EB8C5